MSDASLIDHYATVMISPAQGTSPNLIAQAVREQTVATTKDLKRPSNQDLEAALQIVPLITVGAARGAADIGAPFGVVVSAVMKGAVEGTTKIGGDPAQAARESAEALIQEADRQEADLEFTAVGVVSGATETIGSQSMGVTEAAIRGLLDGAAEISPENGQAVRQALQDTAYLPREPMTRVLGSRSMP